MAEARNFKLSTQIEHDAHYRKNTKLGQRESLGGHVTIFFRNFGTPSILGTAKAYSIEVVRI